MLICRVGVQTKFGRFVLEANAIGLTRVVFPPNAARLADTASLNALICRAARQLENYFQGAPYNFKDLDYDFSELTSFQKKILQTLLRARQSTLAYSELAEMSGFPRSSRAVGTVMNKNPFPILIPCHRVVQAGGELGGYAFGSVWKKRLLEHENALGAAL